MTESDRAGVVALDELMKYLDEELRSGEFEDYCPNGLQVEGRPRVSRLALGVSADLRLFEDAASWGADAVLVHHGLFWGNGPVTLTGVLGRRVAMLVRHEMSLIAYHLPLDAHPVVGNNACLADLLGLRTRRPFGKYRGNAIGVMGLLPEPVSLDEFVRRVEESLGPVRHVFRGGGDEVSKVAVCSGGAKDMVYEAAGCGADVYHTGEAGEPTPALCLELGVNFVAAGHYCTERAGVQALGGLLAERFGLEVRFFEYDNPL